MLWLGMWSWTIVGLFCLLVGVVSLFVSPPAWPSFPSGGPLVPSGVISVISVIFVYMWLRGYIKFAGE
jgi:hypothetical protein